MILIFAWKYAEEIVLLELNSISIVSCRWCKSSNITAQNDFTFDQDKKHCNVFIFGRKDFERVQAKWGIKIVPHCVATLCIISISNAYHAK